MNVLLVAPESELNFARPEVQDVINALSPRVLLGPDATSSNLIDNLHPGLDMLWFMAHGSRDGIKLYDGFFSTSELTQQLRSLDGLALFINSCSSLGIAIDIHDEIRMPIICTITEVKVKVAYRTGAALARHLAAGKTLYEAYELAKPGGKENVFRYLNGGSHGKLRPNDEIMLEIRRGYRRINKRIDEIEKHFAERIDDIEIDLGSRYNELVLDVRSNYQIRHSRRNILLWLAGYGLFVGSIWLLSSGIGEHWGINSVAAAIISMFAFPLAAWFFMTGMGFSLDVQNTHDDS